MMRAEGPIMFAGQIQHRANASAIPPRTRGFLRKAAEDNPTGTWRTRKKANLAIADGLDALGHADLATRMRACGNCLTFARYDLPNGEPLHRLDGGDFCRARLCPVCQALRSRRLFHQLAEATTVFLARRPGDQALLVTLTTKNVPGEALSAEIDRQLEGFKKLMRRKALASVCTGWWRSLEITRNKLTGEFHAHIHVLMFMRPEYFRRQSGLYIDQKNHAWGQLWQSCLGVHYVPHVDVRRVRGVGRGSLTDAGRKSLLEVTKYVTKSDTVLDVVDGNHVVDLDALRAVDVAVHGRRLVSAGGLLRTILRELKQPDPDSDDALTYAGEELPAGAIYVGRFRYGWVDGPGRGEGRYELLEWPQLWNGAKHVYARDGTTYSAEMADL